LAQSRSTPIPLVLDLSLWQSFDYYTGIVFQAVSRTERQWRILGQGGRYDELLGIYHPQQQSAPGIGFCLNLEDLHTCLLLAATSDLPQSIPPSDWLVIPQTPQAEAAAFAHAQTLRNSDHLVRVEIELSGRSPDVIRQFARAQGLKNLAWVAADGPPAIETL
jgi:ATP phosphoribosyltransferase regulatory subunit